MRKSSFFSRSFEVYMKIFVSFGFAFLMLKLILSGTLGYFINPKLIPFVIFCILALLLTSGITFLKAKKTKGSKGFKMSYLIYIIPLIIGFAVPAKTTSMSSLQLESQATSKDKSVVQYNDGSGQDSTVSNESNSPDSAEPTIAPRKTKVVIDDRNYVIEMDRINMFPSEYRDCEIEITGKVFINNKLKSNEFAIVRPMMTCCSADAVLAGFLCVCDGDVKVMKDNWITVFGKINVVDGANEQTVSIKVNNTLPAQKPLNEFVYPY